GEREELIKVLKELSLSYEEQADIITIAIASTLDALPIIERCREYISGFEVLQGTMDDAFIGITGKEIRS
ncbi:MAG: ABC transporter, partial [Firmicutes bacterium]|nr:ABC transporter [Bacillota bacterium]